MEEYNIYVSGVRIGRVIGSADFNLNKYNPYGYSDENGWDLGLVEEEDLSMHDPYSDVEPVVPVDRNDKTVNYTAEYDEPILLNCDFQSVMGKAGNALLIPQELENWNSSYSTYDGGSYIAVKIKVTTKDGGLVFPSKEGYEWVAASLLESEWEAGKRYEYDLYFQNGFGHINPEKGLDPEAPYDPYGDPKLDEDDPYKPGQIIAEGEPIIFKSNMTDWVDEYDGGKNMVNPNN